MVCIVASFLSLHALTPSMLVDVIACVMMVMIVNNVLSSWCAFLSSRTDLLVDECLPLMSGAQQGALKAAPNASRLSS